MPAPRQSGNPPSSAQRNPAWERDELILALDLYVRLDRKIPNEDYPDVVALSELLNVLPIHSDRPDEVRFRNPNGVALKLANFRALDQPGHGMSRGGRLDKVIWDEFVDDPKRLSRLADAIRVGHQSVATPQASEDDDERAFPEGRVAFRLHRSRERSAALVKRKKAAVVAATGALRCEVGHGLAWRSCAVWRPVTASPAASEPSGRSRPPLPRPVCVTMRRRP